jgi:tetratricopeptide (TPR) repeat protein
MPASIFCGSNRRRAGKILALRCNSGAPALCAIFLLFSWHASFADTSADREAARQLVDSTSLANILHADAEQAGLIADHLSDELPPGLQSDFRRAIEQNLGFDVMEQALVDSVASSVDASALENNARWWASEPGRAVTLAESTAYASVFADSTYRIFNHMQAAIPGAMGTVVSDELAARGRFAQFAADVLSSTAWSRSCLIATVGIGPVCPPPNAFTSNAVVERMSQIVAAAANRGYSHVSSGDRGAYLAYLQSDGAQSMLAAMRASCLEIERQHWDLAANQASAAVDNYARVTLGSAHGATLRRTTADIDLGHNLPAARITLNLLQRIGPPDPAVLVQLARVAIKQSGDLSILELGTNVPAIDPANLKTAQHYIEDAIALDPNRAETVMYQGYITYLQLDFRRSIELLEQARSIGTDSPWLRINLGDDLWAEGYRSEPRNRELIQQAAGEFEAALKTKLSEGATWRAVHQLGAIYAALGQDREADVFYRRYISIMEGTDKAFALQRYAGFLFSTHNIDGAIATAREMQRIADFPLGREQLASYLSIKGGMLHESGHAKEAKPFFAEAQQYVPDIEMLCPMLAASPAGLPGLVGIHAEGLAKDFSGSIGGRSLIYVSRYAGAQVIEQLIAWGASPNYFDSQEGTPLHNAILSDNTAAVEALLAHGANPATPFVDGRTPSQLADRPTDPKRAQIRALVASTAAARGVDTGPVGRPLKIGYKYRLKQPITGDRFGNDFGAGDEFIFISECRYTDSTIACLIVKSMKLPDQNRDLAIAKDQLSSWTNWFEELGPADSRGDAH